MAHRRQERRTKLIGSLKLLSTCRLVLQATSIQDRHQLCGDATQQLLALWISESSRHLQLVLLVQANDRGRRLHLTGHDLVTDAEAFVFSATQDRSIELEDPDDLRQDLIECPVAQAHGRHEPSQCPSISLRSSRLCAPSGGEVDERADGERGDQEADQRQDVARVPDRECVDRRGELPVRHQEGHQRRQETRHESTDGGDGEHHQEVGAHGQGQGGPGRPRKEQHRDDREGDGADHQGRHLSARREA